MPFFNRDEVAQYLSGIQPGVPGWKGTMTAQRLKDMGQALLYPGLLDRDPSVAYRGGLLPYLQRTVTDPGDDITEYEQLEWALPGGLLYEPLSGMAKTGGMLAGDVPVDPRVMTQTMVDAPLVGGLLAGATGAAPRGAVLGAFSGGRKQPSEMSASELRAEANALRFPNENLNINAELAQSAKDYFGVTRSPNETGYIMQDGTRLDLSGRHYAGGYEKQGDRFVPEAGRPDYLGGDRAVDHRELYDLKGLKEGEHQWDAVEQLMRETGAVRYMPNQGISIIDGQKVSDKQLKAIVSDFRKSGNSLTVDIDPVGGGSRAVSKTFDRPTVEGVQEFIELGANKAPTAALPGLLSDIRPARENIRTVIDANTIGGDVVGDEIVPIGLLSGGASSSARAQKAIDDIADSMSGPEGYVERIIVDQDNNVIEGAHRLEALRKLGVDEVPVTRIVDPQASFTGKNLMGMRAAIDDVGPVHSDNVNRIVSDIGDMLADPAVAGDPKKVAKVFDFPKGYEKHYQAALKSIELGANKGPTAALPGLLEDQRGLSDFINYGGSDKRQHRGPYKVRGLLGGTLYEASTPGGYI